ncbi:excinuclease ABC subunit UvrA [Candidatus Uhrbacteria bacterium]|nr:excinuclease ABC subunit UvrA [Candidatus Uhrbacteria bacterium]
MAQEYLRVRGARVHNLKNVSVDIPKKTLTVLTGLSGSGKSSLAFDTIHAEGQRRYMESLSSYARQFLEMQDRPDVDEITGLSPTVAIDQKSSSHNPRSTVGTVTEIYDYLRVLFARAGESFCPVCRVPVEEQTLAAMAVRTQSLLGTHEVLVLAPLVRSMPGEHKQVLVAAQAAGFAQARYDGFLTDLDELVAIRKDKKKPHTIEAVVAVFSPEDVPAPERVRDVLKRALEYGNGLVLLVDNETGDETLLSQALACPSCGLNLPKPEPRLFSFNSPSGACASCMGLGIKLVLEEDLVIPNRRLTFAEGAIKPWTRIAGNQTSHVRLLEQVGERHGFSTHMPVVKIPRKTMELVWRGTGEETYNLDGASVTFPGILVQLEEKYRTTESDYVRHELESYMRTMICGACDGKRLKPEMLAVRVLGYSIGDLVGLPLEDLKLFFEKPSALAGASPSAKVFSKDQKQIFETVQKDVLERLRHMNQVGLGYLTLDRSAISLSGGESQRMRLATQLSASLSGIIYILDEPSIGLHPRDNDALIETMKTLRDAGNTVLVVEHDAAMMRAADHIIDVGPGAGEYGGEIVAKGTSAEIKRKKESLTGQYLAGKKTVGFPKRYRAGNRKKITIEGATAHNLQNITVSIPLGTLTCVTGVSGSGKSTLILDILGNALSQKFYRAKEEPGEHKALRGVEHIDKVVMVDQSPIGRTPRSNPATYTTVFTAIRDLFTEVPEAKIRNFDAGKFSFNVKGGGRCEACGGDGMRRIEMQFMPDVYVECTECHGRRYNEEALEIHYKQKNIADVLDMTVEEARRFFADKEAIFEKLDVLHRVGLGYLKLGQPATTLSGGEAQRVKLSTELSRRATGRTLYILDEPTTGLHFEDIKRLLGILHMLVEKGNTVLLIEHNLDVIASSDWVVDMGPEGGAKGGEIIATGTPRDVAKMRESKTGQYLKELFSKKRKNS